MNVAKARAKAKAEVPPGLDMHQAAILLTIKDYLRDHGYPPVYREIAARAGVSLQMVSRRVAELVAAGYLRPRDKFAVRALGLTERARVDVPRRRG
jgi:DNA-binding MarR family transcriptional regulator